MTKFFNCLILISLVTLNWNCGSSDEPKKPVKSTNKVTKSLVKNKTAKNTMIRTSVLKNEQWEFIDSEGNSLTNERYVYADNFSCGMACVNETGERMGNKIIGGRYYFIDVNGNKSDFSFDEAVRYHENLAIVPMGDKRAIIDKKGKVIKDGFDFILHFADGLAPAKKGNTTGYINRTGNWRFKVDNDVQIDVFKNRLARAKKDNKTGFLSISGKWQILPQFEFAKPFSEQRALIRENGKYGFIDEKGKIVIPAQYEDASDFAEGLCNVKKNGKWGYIDRDGELVIDFQFDECRNFHDGLATVSINKKIGFVNRKGELEIKPQFEFALDFHEGRAMYGKGKKVGFIDKKGNIVIPAQYDKTNFFVNVNNTNPLFRR